MQLDRRGIYGDKNVVQKEAENKLKYERLWIEIKRMWDRKCKIITVIYGAIRLVTKGLRKNLEVVPGKHLKNSI